MSCLSRCPDFRGVLDEGFHCSYNYYMSTQNTSRMVSRRYKHYDWLHQRLMEKFTVTAVPPLPDKQYYGEIY